MSVCKTNKHLYVQIIDDDKGHTLASCGTASKNGQGKSKEIAANLGKKIAALAKEKNIEKIVFDRGRYKFHGLIAELANSARQEGLQF